MWLRDFVDSARARWHGLRCRPGDVCWVRRDAYGKTDSGVTISVRGGAVVRVTRLDPEYPATDGMWKIEKPIRCSVGYVHGIKDHLLIPLRDKPAADETLTWCEVAKPVASPATKPVKETA